MRQREDGVTLAYTKHDGPCFVLPFDAYDRLKTEWASLPFAFFSGTNFYGAPITIKLGDIVAVTQLTAEQLKAARDDSQEDDREDALHV